MPGLPKRQNHDGFDAYFGQHDADITSPLLPTKSSACATMASNIKYIAPQMDPLAGSSTKAARQSPMRLMIQDAGVLLTMLPYLPNIFLPLKAKDSSDELYMNVQGARDAIFAGLANDYGNKPAPDGPSSTFDTTRSCLDDRHRAILFDCLPRELAHGRPRCDLFENGRHDKGYGGESQRRALAFCQRDCYGVRYILYSNS